MKIGVLSDSHDNLPLIQKAIDCFLEEKVEKVVHCGDMVAPFIGRVMQSLKQEQIETLAVYGNNDGERDAFLKMMGDFVSFKGEFAECLWDDCNIAVYHGTINSLLECIIDSKHYNLVLTGHTHEIRIEEREGVLIVNPGECCGYLTGKATCAIIDLSSQPLFESAVKIIDLN